MNSEFYWLWLCCIPQLYPPQRESLLKYFGSPEAVFRAPVSEFDLWDRLNLRWIAHVRSARSDRFVSGLQEDMAKRQIRFVSREHPDFPRRLLETADPPCGLFYRGSLPSEDVLSVAIVGARICSGYGRESAAALAGALARAGVSVISGMARGIDGAAQSSALENGGRSFAVLGCGADVCYPPESRHLYDALVRQGGVISEFPPGTRPLGRHFPIRNRIISGLCDKLLVIEARSGSGSLITADCALEQGRDVFALPGRMDDPLSFGCNRLLQEGAGVILSPQDLMSQLGLSPSQAKKTPVSLTEDERLVYSLIGHEPVGMDFLSARSGLDSSVLSLILLGLQRRELIREEGRNMYSVRKLP